MVYPKYERAYKIATLINHEIIFNYTEAFRLNQQWLEHNKGLLASEADFAEKHFTTGRFTECEERITRLLADPTLEANTKISLQAIEIANLLAIGKGSRVPSRMDSLIEAITSQPADFRVTWQFGGTRRFINQHEKLASHRAWLDQLFVTIGGSNREDILKSLKEIRAKFKQ